MSMLSVDPAKVVVAHVPGREDATAAGFVEGESVERTDKRNATRRVFDNPDGTTTEVVSPVPTSYRDERGDWREIDTSVVADRTARGAGRFVSKANEFTAVFDSGRVGYSLVVKGERAGFFAEGAAGSAPVVEGSVVSYVDAFPGVDVRYTVTGSGVKADYVLNRRPDRSVFVTALEGAKVTGRPDKPKDERARDLSAGLTFSGAIGERMVIAPPVVSDAVAANFFPEAKATIEGAGARLVASVDPVWLATVPDSAFPLLVDPTTVYPAADWYVAYKSDGYSCTYPTCAARIGNSLGGPGGGDTTYRTVQHVPFPNGMIVGASLSWEPPSYVAVNGTGVGVTSSSDGSGNA